MDVSLAAGDEVEVLYLPVGRAAAGAVSGTFSGSQGPTSLASTASEVSDEAFPLWLLVLACGCGTQDRWPNPDHLSVEGEGGVPVFSWRDRDAETLTVVDPHGEPGGRSARSATRRRA